ncbi:LysE family translocator [Agrobacterium vitis]|uniref:LysE family translocator n=1 Tax=Agrobacterium vitis TaxID=373 RepID=A0ABD6GIC3_AGRVI|nr:LysE family translocator [Agrobacterium vitis]MUO80074.1 LysE family translocator [Agrobacterium vitis]MUO97858.1 LysE family translocator [Agrobacterium vitis]MUP08018.1 LysE family translocator [Agrobacterium vitis]MUZ82510.1 LysE family translocator [Agrobacterium vitis]MVA09851.1 LysE family translocator [Agrobacterium vitis]
MPLDFYLTSLIIVATPGTGALYTLTVALSGGWRAATIAAFGCTLGILPHMAAASFGLAAILAANETLFQAVKIAGVVYLLYMAASLWRGGEIEMSQEQPQPYNALRIIGKAVLINLLNPKLSLFFLAFLPQFVDGKAPQAIRQFVLCSGLFMAMTFIVFALYGWMASGLRKHILSKPRTVKTLYKGFSAAFLLMSVRLALAER